MLNGRPGFLVFQDVKHLDFDLVHHAPKASSSFERLHNAFAAGQARFSAPSRSDFDALPLPARCPRRSSWPASMNHVLQKAVELNHKDFQRWAAENDRQADVKARGAAKLFVQQPDVANSSRWLEAFPCLPPWAELERIAQRLSATLHEDALPWMYASSGEYVAEMLKVKDWFVKVLPGNRCRVGILRERGEDADEVGAAFPCVTPSVLDIFQRCEDEVYLRGCMNWSYLCRCARAVGLEMVSGTTDLEVLNSEIISIFRAGRITRLGEELFNLHMDMLFLRLARRRSHSALETVIAHGKDAISQEIAIMVESLRWFEEEDAEELMCRWQEDLNNLRSSLPRVLSPRMRLVRRRLWCKQKR